MHCVLEPRTSFYTAFVTLAENEEQPSYGAAAFVPSCNIYGVYTGSNSEEYRELGTCVLGVGVVLW